MKDNDSRRVEFLASSRVLYRNQSRLPDQWVNFCGDVCRQYPGINGLNADEAIRFAYFIDPMAVDRAIRDSNEREN